MKCLIDNIGSSISKQYEELGLNEKLADVDRKATLAAGNNGILDFPLASAFVDQISAFLQKTGTGLASAAVSSLVSNITQSSAFTTISGGLSIAATVATAGVQLKSAVLAMMAESLKRELRIRAMYYKLIQYHVNGIMTALAYYANPTNNANRQRLQLALRYVKSAKKIYDNIERNTRNIGTDLGLPLPNNISTHAFNTFFNETDRAIKILRGDPAYGKQLLDAIYGKTRSTTWQILQEKFNQQVLATNLYVLESTIWNMSRLIQIIPIPLTNLAYTEGLFVKDSTIYGVNAVKFNKTDADRAIENLKNASGWNNTFSAVDAAKGLLPTNMIIEQLVAGLSTFSIDFGNLSWASNRILDALSPMGSMITQLATDMQGALTDDDSELMLAAKQTLWVAELEAIKLFQQAFLSSIMNLDNTTDLVNDIQILQRAAITYSDTTRYDAKILLLMADLVVSVPKALMSNRALKRNIVIGNTLLQLIQKSINIDKKLLNAAESVNIQQNGLISELTKALESAPPPAGEIMKAITSGQLATVTALFTGLVSSGKDIINSLSELSKCKEERGTSTDGAITELDEIDYARYDLGYT